MAEEWAAGAGDGFAAAAFADGVIGMGRVMMGCRFEHKTGVGIKGLEGAQEVLVAALRELNTACCVDSVDFVSSCPVCLWRGEEERGGGIEP